MPITIYRHQRHLASGSKFNARIVALSVVGMADSAQILLDASEITQLPFGLGARAQTFARNVTTARYDQTDGDELFLPPVVLPGLPVRNYFVFGKAMSTEAIDPKDKDSCQEVYQDLQGELQRGLDDVLQARKQGKFESAIPRLVYERRSAQTAPTFPITEMTRNKSQ